MRRLQKVTFIVVYVITAYYLLINGSGLFQEWNNSWVTTTMIYLIGVGVMLGLDERVPRELGREQYRSDHNILSIFLVFGLTLIAFYVLFIGLYVSGVFFQGVQAPPAKYVLPTLIYQGVIVVASEEIIFRGVLFRYFRDLLYSRRNRAPWMAILIQGLLFSVFHTAAYSLNWNSLVFALVMGLFLGFLTYRFNIGAALGVHFMWNAMALGLLLPPV